MADPTSPGGEKFPQALAEMVRAAAFRWEADPERHLREEVEALRTNSSSSGPYHGHTVRRADASPHDATATRQRRGDHLPGHEAPNARPTGAAGAARHGGRPCARRARRAERRRRRRHEISARRATSGTLPARPADARAGDEPGKVCGFGRRLLVARCPCRRCKFLRRPQTATGPAEARGAGRRRRVRCPGERGAAPDPFNRRQEVTWEAAARSAPAPRRSRPRLTKRRDAGGLGRRRRRRGELRATLRTRGRRPSAYQFSGGA